MVGLPGAGKSTVGPLLAERLGGWRFVDLDAEIERTTGRTVAEIFATDGEAAFRQLERETTQRLAAGGPVGMVLAPGGGWILDSANLSALGAATVTVYLRVSPTAALRRMAGAAAARPLLATSDPLASLKALLEAREAVYLQANHTVAAESMSPDAIADSIVALVSSGQGH